jgi:Protein of unknown function (DUF3037)
MSTTPVTVERRDGPSTAGYQYVVLRCVPRVDREEFVNVGVVLYSQAAGYLAVGSHLNGERLKALDPEIDLAAVQDALDGYVAACQDSSPLANAGLRTLGQRFGWLVAPRSTVVQPGPVHGGLTGDPARQLEHLLESLVR